MLSVQPAPYHAAVVRLSVISGRTGQKCDAFATGRGCLHSAMDAAHKPGTRKTAARLFVESALIAELHFSVPALAASSPAAASAC